MKDGIVSVDDMVDLDIYFVTELIIAVAKGSEDSHWGGAPTLIGRLFSSCWACKEKKKRTTEERYAIYMQIVNDAALLAGYILGRQSCAGSEPDADSAARNFFIYFHNIQNREIQKEFLEIFEQKMADWVINATPSFGYYASDYLNDLDLNLKV